LRNLGLFVRAHGEVVGPPWSIKYTKCNKGRGKEIRILPTLYAVIMHRPRPYSLYIQKMKTKMTDL